MESLVFLTQPIDTINVLESLPIQNLLTSSSPAPLKRKPRSFADSSGKVRQLCTHHA